jgi:LysM repeat protein
LTGLRATVYHTVRKGETLGGIACRYGTSIGKICALNGISRKKILGIGSRLVIRKFHTAEQVSAPDVKTIVDSIEVRNQKSSQADSSGF